jgi:hypothetical protein
MTPERLKEIRALLDSGYTWTNLFDELYDEVSSRMPVSVEERLPEHDEVSLWFIHSGLSPRWLVGKFRSDAIYDVASVELVDECYPAMQPREPVLCGMGCFSHWMPIPPRPQEGRTDD